MDMDGQFDHFVAVAARDVERAASLVAKTFYRILRKNGFSDDQIVCVASNLLDCLIQALEEYKGKTLESNTTRSIQTVADVRKSLTTLTV